MIARVSTCQEYFDTLNDRFIPDQAKGVQTTVVYEISGEGGGTWTVNVNDGALAIESGGAEKADVTLKMNAKDYIDMANGDLDGTKAFMTRKLKVQGKIPMAQKMKKFLPPRPKD